MAKSVYTIKVVNTTFTAVGSSIDMLNVGLAKGSFTGNSAHNDIASVAVDLPVNGSYTLEYTQEGYAGILIDATGTEIHVVIKK
jgi:hypothetical protein